MGFEKHLLRYPFSGARSRVTKPVPDDANVPKQWDNCGICSWGTPDYQPFLWDPVETDLQVGDPAFIISGAPPIALGTTIVNIAILTITLDVPNFDQDHFCCLAKFGVGAQHTFQTLADIITARGVDLFTFRFNKLWTTALLQAFNRDETGDVYCIAPT